MTGRSGRGRRRRLMAHSDPRTRTVFSQIAVEEWREKMSDTKTLPQYEFTAHLRIVVTPEAAQGGWDAVKRKWENEVEGAAFDLIRGSEADLRAWFEGN